MMSEENSCLREIFKDPPAMYRGAPFWAWNCKLDKPEILRQIDVFREMGFGGFFMHARTGLKTEYLGKEFMECIKCGAEYAAERGMRAWLYDENGFPSGYGGGLVTRDKRYRGRYLKLGKDCPDVYEKEFAVNNGLPYLVACYDIETDGAELISYKRIDAAADAVYDKYYAVSYALEESERFNNETYADVLNPGAAEKFVSVTHEKYSSETGEYFGSAIPGIFTDEPQMVFNRLPISSVSGITTAWTADFEQGFYEEFKTDILAVLPEVFWDTKDKRHTYRFREYLCRRFVNSFTKIINDRCRENGIMLVGHMMAEQTMQSQTEKIGEAMRHYGEFGIPGVDMLQGRHEYLTVKQAQSAAHQLGVSQVLSELYGVTDWDYDFRGYKEQGDWQAALGVTLRVPHLALMSLKGEAKRDYPASISYQSPWYKEFGLIEDHFARLNTVLTRGKPIVRVGVIHPIESFWHECVCGHEAMRQQLDNNLEELIKWLLFGNIDFDFISEGLTEKLDVSFSDNKICIGKACYSVILVPGCTELRSFTRRILNKFSQNGGKVVYAGAAPRYERGEYSPMEVKTVPFDKLGILNELEDWRDIKITHKDGTAAKRFIYNYRRDEKCRWLFVCYGAKRDNEQLIRPEKTPEETIICIRGMFKPTEYDTLNGDIRKIAFTCKDGYTYIYKNFYSNDSLLVSLESAFEESSFKACDLPEAVEVFRFKGKFGYRLDEKNAFLLDCARYALDYEGVTEEYEELLRIGDICRKRLIDDNIEKQHKLKLVFDVVSKIRIDNVFLALENARYCEITFNGTPIKTVPQGFYVDKDIETVALGCVKVGLNRIEIQSNYNIDSDVEWMYLLGDFGVEINGTEKVITQKPQEIGFSDITSQGLPFYGGNISYITEFVSDGGDFEIAVPKYKGALIRVYLDKKDCGVIALEPYRLKLGSIAPGKHIIELKLFTNRYNSFGSVHNAEAENRWAGPERWRTKGDKWGYEYFLRDAGILSGPIIYKYSKRSNDQNV